MRQWLVLCQTGDLSALWAYRGLKARGLVPLELVSAELLAYSLRWEHRLGADGVSTSIALADGRTIRSVTIAGVLNRLHSVPSSHLERAQPADRDYASQELAAFFLSWLSALPGPMLNRPTPHGLAGEWRHPSEWVWLASSAGLPTARYVQTSRGPIHDAAGEPRLVAPGTRLRTLIVVDRRVVGVPAPPHVLSGCQRLAELARTALLGVDFAATSADPWTFAGATPLPDLRLGGERLLDALAAVLRGSRLASA